MLLAAPISAPIAEEIAKALGVLVLFWFLRAEFDNMRDGIVYGALVGAGFNWFEAALYVAQNYAEHGVATYGLQLGARYALFGLRGHAMFTAMFGAFPWRRDSDSIQVVAHARAACRIDARDRGAHALQRPAACRSVGERRRRRPAGTG